MYFNGLNPNVTDAGFNNATKISNYRFTHSPIINYLCVIFKLLKMKKLILAAMVFIAAFLMTGCGASRKTGCPTVAKIINTLSVQS